MEFTFYISFGSPEKPNIRWDKYLGYGVCIGYVSIMLTPYDIEGVIQDIAEEMMWLELENKKIVGFNPLYDDIGDV